MILHFRFWVELCRILVDFKSYIWFRVGCDTIHVELFYALRIIIREIVFPKVFTHAEIWQ